MPGASSGLIGVLVVAVLLVVGFGIYYASTPGTNVNTSSTSTLSSSTTSRSVTSSTSSSSVVNANFFLQVEPTDVFIGRQMNESYSVVKVTALVASDATVTLRVLGLAAGVSANFSSSSVSLSGAAQTIGLFLATTQSAPFGQIDATVAGIVGSVNRTDILHIHIVPHLIQMLGATFLGGDLTVRQGESVVWVNLDGQLTQYDQGTHNVLFMSGATAGSPALSQYASWSYTFNQAGTYDYYCTYHPTMKGTITVTQG